MPFGISVNLVPNIEYDLKIVKLIADEIYEAFCNFEIEICNKCDGLESLSELRLKVDQINYYINPHEEPAHLRVQEFPE